MPENTTLPNGETPNGTSPQGETPNTSETGETSVTKSSRRRTIVSVDDASEEIERLEAQLKKVNAESASHRHKANELDKLKAEIEASKLSETERWQKQATDLQSKYESDTAALTERIVRYEVERQAAKLGIIDPDAAAQLIDWDQIEYDSDGTPSNADALLKDLLKSKPYLAGKTQASAGGATNPSRAASNAAGELSWEVITKMTSEQYNARRAEIQQWMMRNPMRRI